MSSFGDVFCITAKESGGILTFWQKLEGKCLWKYFVQLNHILNQILSYSTDEWGHLNIFNTRVSTIRRLAQRHIQRR